MSPTCEHRRGGREVSRLAKNLSRNWFGNVLNDRQFGRLFGRGHLGNRAGIVIPTTNWITPLSGEPPIAKTNGWGQVPGQS
jgi:hypothetical protein